MKKLILVLCLLFLSYSICFASPKVKGFYLGMHFFEVIQVVDEWNELNIQDSVKIGINDDDELFVVLYHTGKYTSTIYMDISDSIVNYLSFVAEIFSVSRNNVTESSFAQMFVDAYKIPIMMPRSEYVEIFNVWVTWYEYTGSDFIIEIVNYDVIIKKIKAKFN